MVPIVNFKKSVAGDKRKLRELCYKEARLALAYPLGSVSPTYCASINDVNTIGKNLRWCASVAGLSKTTYIHGVGDGAQWIANQVKVKFGDVKNNYLIDMYHMTEYLADASKIIYSDSKEQRLWLKEQSDLLKQNNSAQVMLKIKPYKMLNPNNAAQECYQYLENRPNQLNYQHALVTGLPIGSGKIEGGNKCIIQNRLKISGAWWAESNVNPMLALRTTRSNDKWADYWESFRIKKGYTVNPIQSTNSMSKNSVTNH